MKGRRNGEKEEKWREIYRGRGKNRGERGGKGSREKRKGRGRREIYIERRTRKEGEERIEEVKEGRRRGKRRKMERNL